MTIQRVNKTSAYISIAVKFNSEKTISEIIKIIEPELYGLRYNYYGVESVKVESIAALDISTIVNGESNGS